MTALIYEAPMFQEFSTQNRTHAYLVTVLFPIWVYVYALFFLRLTVFSKPLLDASISCHNYANIWQTVS